MPRMGVQQVPRKLSPSQMYGAGPGAPPPGVLYDRPHTLRDYGQVRVYTATGFALIRPRTEAIIRNFTPGPFPVAPCLSEELREWRACHARAQASSRTQVKYMCVG